jgi:hypothetical protein
METTTNYFTKPFMAEISVLSRRMDAVQTNSEVKVPSGVLAFWTALAAQNCHAWADAVAQVGEASLDASGVDWGKRTAFMGLSPDINIPLWRGQTPAAIRGVTELFSDGASARQIYEWAAGVVQPGPVGLGILAPQPGNRPGIIWSHTTTSGRNRWEVRRTRSGGWCVEISTHGSGGQMVAAGVVFDQDGTNPIIEDHVWDQVAGATPEFLAEADWAICIAWCA